MFTHIHAFTESGAHYFFRTHGDRVYVTRTTPFDDGSACTNEVVSRADIDHPYPLVGHRMRIVIDRGPIITTKVVRALFWTYFDDGGIKYSVA